MNKQWRIEDTINLEEAKELSKKLNIDKIVTAIMIKRGLETSEKILNFLEPKLKHLHSPKHILDMDKGTDLIISAINEQKKIVIYGDYDCDGVTSTTIMYKGLTRCGAQVVYHIPDRIDEGYGMNNDTIERLHREGNEVIITCDNGISCTEQVRFAKKLGMKIIITDHHEIPFELDEEGNGREIIPEGDAVINPKRRDCSYPFKNLCGAGVAFKFIHTLYVKLGIDSKELFELIELAAIGTVCDVVDLKDENRVIVSMGLKMLNETKNIGLRALIKEIGYEGKKIRAGNVGYQIGPCINATGRLDSASLSVELLLCKDSERAELLAKNLRKLNQERQQMTDKALEETIELIEGTNLSNDKVLVIFKEELHESLAGIIAGRVRERYNKPVYVVTRAKDKAKGSGRSIESYDMFAEISKCKDILLGAGGHPMAAGFSLEEDKIQLFRERLNSECTLNEDDLTLKIDVDSVVGIKDISFELIKDLEKLEPFGKGNSEPKFLLNSARIDKIFLMGQNKEHMRITCFNEEMSSTIQGVKFHEGDIFKKQLAELYGEEKVEFILDNPSIVNLRMDVLFKPSINEWNNTKTVQMQIVDYKIC